MGRRFCFIEKLQMSDGCGDAAVTFSLGGIFYSSTCLPAGVPHHNGCSSVCLLISVFRVDFYRSALSASA